MKVIQPILFLTLQLVHLLVPTHGIKSWCKDQLEGFTLEDDYNPNSPPTKNFTLKDMHVLYQVEEVRKDI